MFRLSDWPRRSTSRLAALAASAATPKPTSSGESTADGVISRSIASAMMNTDMAHKTTAFATAARISARA